MSVSMPPPSSSSSSSTMSQLVEKRLEDIVEAHEVHLSRVTSRSSSLPSTLPSTSSSTSVSIAEAATVRSHTSQPPLQCSVRNGDAELVTELDLNPPERAKPQDLLRDCYHQGDSAVGADQDHDRENDIGTGLGFGMGLGLPMGMGEGVGVEGGINPDSDGTGAAQRQPQRGPLQPSASTSTSDHLNYHKTTIKAITTLSALLEETHELHSLAIHRYIPQIHLFCHSTSTSTSTSTNSSTHQNTNVDIFHLTEQQQLDETLLLHRDHELLKRMGKFLPTLQQIYNLITRIHDLIANMLLQLHGCTIRPLYDWSTDVQSLNGLDAGYDRHGNLLSEHEPALFGGGRGGGGRGDSGTNGSSLISMVPLVEGLMSLLEVLVKVDAVVAGNEILAEAWDLYKSVVLEDLEDGGAGAGAGFGFGVGGGMKPVPFVDIRLGGGDDEEDAASEFKEDGNTDQDDFNRKSDDAEMDAETQQEPALVGEEEAAAAAESSSQEHSRKDLMKLQQMLMQLDFTLLSSRSFLIAIEQNFDPTNQILTESRPTRANSSKKKKGGSRSKASDTPATLHNQLKHAIETLYQKYCDAIGTEREYSGSGSIPIIGLYGLYCLYRRILPSQIAPDEALHRSLCTTLPSKIPMMPLFGSIPFYPVEFVGRYAPLDRIRGGSISTTTMMMNPTMDNVKAVAKKKCKKFDKTFGKDVNVLFIRGLKWIVDAESGLAPSDGTSNGRSSASSAIGGVSSMGSMNELMLIQEGGNDDNDAIASISSKLDLIRRGIELAQSSTNLLHYYLTMHSNLNEPIPSAHLRPIEKLCSVAKSVEQVLRRRRRDCVVAIHGACLKLIAADIFKSLNLLRSHIDHCNSSLQNSTDLSLKRIHMARIGASLSCLESLLKGTSTFTTTRLCAIKVAIYACYEDHPDVRSRLNMPELEDLFYQLQLLSGDKLGFEACDCSFLYFHKVLFAPLIRHSLHSGSNSAFSKLQLIFSALSDPINNILATSTYLKVLCDNQSIYVDQYRSYLIQDVMLQEIVLPLVESVESVLRHRIHTRNIPEMPMLNPKQQNMDNFVKFLDFPPICICGTMFSIKTAVERLLERSLYNSSTVGLKDTNTHVEMMCLAKSYGLNLMDSFLPAGSADQGMDIMAIVNDLENFLAKFSYNMNQQNFVQKVPIDGRRYVNSVDIECMSMSLSRHGFGLTKVATQVIFAYITKAVQELSKTLSNEAFYSIMAKEKRWFEEETKGGATCYPYDRAQAFKVDILQVDGSDMKPLLYSVKDVITRIGNALGLARLLRSAKLYNVSKSNEFFAKDNLTNVKIDARNPISRCVQPLKSALESSTLQTIPTFFPDAETIRSSPWNDEIWESLYILFPSLSLSWLEASVSGKEMLRKKIKTSEGYYTDDGFAVGFAYLFEILNPEQGKFFDGTNWRKSCVENFTKEKTEVRVKADTIRGASGNPGDPIFVSVPDQSFSGNDEDSEYTRLQVLAKRVETRRREMELLHYSMYVSRMIFSCN